MCIAFGVIPARLDSTRLPGKLLHPLNGKPIIQHTYENAIRCPRLKAVYIATDSEKIAEVAYNFGAEVIMTSRDCRNGTARVAEAIGHEPRLSEAETIVNIQGDEPFLDSSVIDALIEALDKCLDADIATAITPFTSETLWRSPSVVKCVKDCNDYAMYFSRAPIPGTKSAQFPERAYQHLGLYAYRPDFLRKLPRLHHTPLQQIEDLEQLQFLELGFKIATAIVHSDSIGIDTLEDLKRAEEYLCKKNTSS